LSPQVVPSLGRDFHAPIVPRHLPNRQLRVCTGVDGWPSGV
jgi:hypothetical protein